MRGDILFWMTAYALVLIGIAVVAKRRTATTTDYYVGGRRVSGFVTGFSYIATDISASGMIGIAGLAYGLGATAIVWMIIVYNIAIALAYFLVAPRLRAITERHGCHTVPDYFAARLGTRYAQWVPAAVIIIFLIPLMVVQLTGAALLFSQVLGLDYNVSIIVFGLLVALYVVVGGYLSIAWTDTLQGIILLFGLLIIAPLAVSQAGGLNLMLDAYHSADSELLRPWGHLGFLTVIAISGSFFMGVLGVPQLLQRFFAVRETRKDIAVGLSISVTVQGLLILSVLAGIAGRVLLPEVENPDNVMPLLVVEVLPAILAGFLTAALLSALLSTLDSVLLVVGSAAANDVYGKLVRPEASERRRLVVARLATAGAGLIAIGLAFNPPEFITLLMAFVFGALGIIIGIPLIATLYSDRATPQGVLACWVVGLVSYVGWNALDEPWGLPTFLMSIVCTVAALVVVSALTQGRAAAAKGDAAHVDPR